jgi:hypothetical protein
LFQAAAHSRIAYPCGKKIGLDAGNLLQPPLRSHLGPFFQSRLPFNERGLELFLAHIGVADFREHLAREIAAQAAVFEFLLVAAAIVKGAYAGRHLDRPEGFSLDVSASLALFAKIFALAAVDSANWGVIQIDHERLLVNKNDPRVLNGVLAIPNSAGRMRLKLDIVNSEMRRKNKTLISTLRVDINPLPKLPDEPRTSSV